MLRIKKILKDRKKSQQWLAKQMGITYSGLKLRYKNPTYNSIKEIADVLDITVIELLEAPQGFSHFYHEITGEYLGVRKI